MNKETEVYYNNYFELFRTKGWKQLVEELVNNSLVINNISSTKDELDLNFRKGQLNIIGSLVNLETTIQNAFEEANSEESLDD